MHLTRAHPLHPLLQEPGERGILWVLKEEQHRGTGVHVTAMSRAISQGKVREHDAKYSLVHVSNQMTVVGRKFYSQVSCRN